MITGRGPNLSLLDDGMWRNSGTDFTRFVSGNALYHAVRISCVNSNKNDYCYFSYTNRLLQMDYGMGGSLTVTLA